jgi:hypothetical protein
MIPRVPLREALSDPNLLGAAIGGEVMADTPDCGDGRRAP